MAETKYVRLAPYDPRRGRLKMRYCVGGKVFDQDQWYRVPAGWADELAKLEQETGAPVFEVYDEDGYRQQVYAEQSAIAQQVAQQLGATQAATPSPSTVEGPQQSQWEGLEASEVSPAEQRAQAAAQAQQAAGGGTSEQSTSAQSTEPQASEQSEGPDLEAMTKRELLAHAKAQGLDVGDDWGARRLRTAIRNAS